MPKRPTGRRRKSARRGRSGSISRPPPSTPEVGAPQIDLTPLVSPLRVISRSFALLALRLVEPRLRKSGGERARVGARARFLQAMGLETNEIAELLDSTPRSISELLSRARRTRTHKASGKRRG